MNDSDCNPSTHSRHFEAVLAQFLLAEEQGLRPDPQQWLARHPELAGRLRAFFDDRAWFGREAPGLAPTPSTAEPRTVAENVAGVAAEPPLLAAMSRFAGYEILSELGKGGMGIVYKARQLNPDRLVALKVIRTDRLEELANGERRQWIDRFYREAQLVAALDQPAHIVNLYEVGERDSQPYFTMRLVEGGSLAQRLRDVKAQGPDQAAAWRVHEQRGNARLLAQAARAVHYAHQRGILHRDLKPANILLDTDGQPLVTDFGLARRLDETGSLVQSAIEGTAPYMAPEQAIASKGSMTTAADVYSLGAILYELLTGKPPFKGKNDVETLLMVVKQPPIAPRNLDRRLHRDLETICLKCLEKEPARRYPSAAGLADDLENWLAGRPINARPAGPLERTWRWCRRNPVPAVAAGVVLAIAVVAFALIADSRNTALALAHEKGKLADDNGKLAEEKGKLAKRNGVLAQEKTTEAERAKKEASRAQDEEQNARREAMRLAFQQAKALSDQGEIGRSMHVLAHGLGLAEKAEEPDLERLFRANLAAWRYHLHTLRHILPHPAGVSAVAWSPDGRTLATACWDQTTRLWDVASGRPRSEPLKHDERITGVLFSPDGKTLLTVGYAKVGVWEAETGQRVTELDHKPASVTCAAFAPDNHTILTGSTDGKARLWTRSGNRLDELLSQTGWIEAVAFAPDGRFFATGGKRGGIIVWEAASRRPAVTLQHPGGVTALAFGEAGRLLSGGEDRTARLWNLAGPRIEPIVLAHQEIVKAVALSPDGALAATASLDGMARVWDATTGEAVGQPLVHAGEVLAVAFGPDGRTLATGHGRERGDARVWDVSLGNPLGGLLTHAGSILAVAVSPDGKRTATAGRDHVARLWDAHTGEPIGDTLPHNAEVNAVAFSPDSQTLVSGGDDSTALFWQAVTGKPVVREYPGFGKTQFAVGSGNGGGISDMGGEQRGEPFWGPARGKSMGRRGKDGAAVFALAFSPDGKKLVTAGRGGNAVLWDAQRGARFPFMRLKERDKNPLGFTRAQSNPDLYAAAFSPDGHLIALGGRDGTVRLWDAMKFDMEAIIAKAKKSRPEDTARLWDEVTAPRLVGGPLKHGGQVVALAFSPDGKALLTGCSDRTGCLWDVATARPRLTLKHQGAVVAVAFSADGQTFMTGSWDGAARVWKTATGAPACPPLSHRAKVLAVAFSPDGGTVLTGSEDWTARLWDAATGQPIGPPLRHQDQVRAVAFRPDGRAAITAGDDRVGRLWPVPEAAEGSAGRLRNWVEALTGMRRVEDGSIQLLEVTEWQATVARLGDGEPVAPADRLGWNRQQARVDATAGRWLAARWHLDRLIAADPEAGPLYLRRGQAALAMRDVAGARRDFDKAAALLPAEWEPWFQRGRLAINENRWQEAIDNMDKALERQKSLDQVPLRGPTRIGSTAIRVGRGYAQAALGRWKEATDDLAQVRSPFEESSPSDWAAYALVLLKSGNSRSFAAACRQMLATFNRPQDEPKSAIVTGPFGRREVFYRGKPFDPQAAATMAWVCCLSREALADFALPLRQPLPSFKGPISKAPKSLAAFAQILRQAQRAALQDKNNYVFARAYGAVLYRAKDYKAAVTQLEAAAALRKQPSPSVWLFLAMAQQRCERKDQAREWLGKARDWIARARHARPGAEGKDELAWDRLPWTERLALEFLQAEAEKLIQTDAARP